MHWRAFESWAQENDETAWNGRIIGVIEAIVDNDIPADEQLELIRGIDQELTDLDKSLTHFNQTLHNQPTAVGIINSECKLFIQ